MMNEMVRSMLALCPLLEKEDVQIDMLPKESLLNPILTYFVGRKGSENKDALFYAYLLNQAYHRKDKELVIATIKFVAASIDEEEYLYREILRYRQMANIDRCYYENLLRNMELSNEVKKRFTGKPVVYTAITGSYDNVKEPLHKLPGVDYFLFTNNPNLKSEKWKVIFLENEEKLDNVRLARKIKLLGHEILEAYDYSIWVDGKLQIRDDLLEYISANGGENAILCFNHPAHDCVYQEIELCKTLQKDSAEIMQEQINRYLDEGYPEHNGMIDSACLVRDLHDEQLRETMKIWWNEVLNGSRRDQLSFNYACWKNKQKYDTSKLNIYSNKYFTNHAHNA